MTNSHYTGPDGLDITIEESDIDPEDPNIEKLATYGFSFADVFDYCDLRALANDLNWWIEWAEDNDIDPTESFTIGVEEDS